MSDDERDSFSSVASRRTLSSRKTTARFIVLGLFKMTSNNQVLRILLKARCIPLDGLSLPPKSPERDFLSDDGQDSSSPPSLSIIWDFSDVLMASWLHHLARLFLHLIMGLALE